MILRSVLRLLLIAALATPHTGVAQSNALLKQVEAAAAAEALSAVPRLALGTHVVETDVPTEASFFWLEVPENGLYDISLSDAGAVTLFTFPNASGAHDGRTRPVRLARYGSALRPPSIEGVLLAGGRPVLLAANSFAPVSVTYALAEALGAPQPTPEEGSALAPGRYLFQPEGRMRVSVSDSQTPLQIAITQQAGSSRTASIGGATVPDSGLFPLILDVPSRLDIDVRAPGEAPTPLVRVEIAAASAQQTAGDERERVGQTTLDADLRNGFTGTLLSGGDKDDLMFEVTEAGSYDLSVAADARWPGFSAMLLQADSDDRLQELWRAEAVGGSVLGKGFHLDPGRYQLDLRRMDADPQAVGYTARLTPTLAAAEGEEREPNNTVHAAQPLPAARALRGVLAQDDADFFTFSIPDDQAGRLWRIIAVGADRMLLTEPAGPFGSYLAIGPRVTADVLRLVPGEHVIELRGSGAYALRVIDLGPAGEDYEGEPNDAPATGQRLGFGGEIRGSFHHANDLDFVLFRLDRESTIALSITPPDDGPMDARLSVEGAQWGADRDFAAGDPTYTYRATLPPGEWQLQLRNLSPVTRGTYRVSLERVPTPVDGEANDLLGQAMQMPLSGDLSGGLGAFDSADHIIARMPEAAGQVLVTCDAPERLGFVWRGSRFSDGAQLAAPRTNLYVLDHGDPALAGGLHLALKGAGMPFSYTCAQRFAPEAIALPDTGNAEALAPGQSATLTLTEEVTRLDVPLALGPGAVAALACLDGQGQVVPVSERIWSLRDADLAQEPLGALSVLRSRAAPQLQLRVPRDALPYTLSCHLYGLDDLRRPSDMGPLAALVPGPESGFPGAALASLLASAPPAAQPGQDLPLEITFADAPALAAYVRSGQRLAVRARVRNTGDETLDLRFALEATGAGWRTEVTPDGASLAPGAEAEVALRAEVPPWQSPVSSAALILRAEAPAGQGGALLDLPADPLAPPLDPMVFWDAPDVLRGGLNVLHAGLGSRIVSIDGKDLSEKDAAAFAVLHDGLAPHAAAKPSGKDLVFALGAPSELAGMMVQLRTTQARSSWPVEVEVSTSMDGVDWGEVHAAPLAPVHAPQYLPFAAVQRAAFLRIHFARCAEACDRVRVQEVQAIAPPGRTPEGLGEINIARPNLGGHIVTSQPPVSGAWSIDLLDTEKRNSGWKPRQSPHVIVLGFHHNRAARISQIRWVASPDDVARPAGAVVEYATTIPAGPWSRLGDLPAPPIGTDAVGVIDLPDPIWARYLRLTVPVEDKEVGPDAIEVIEAPGHSVLALWEDDSPRAAFEAETQVAPPVPVAPAGGPTRDSAVPFALGTAVESSVLLERNEDWWRLEVPDGPPQVLTLDYPSVPLEVDVQIEDADGAPVAITREEAAQGTVLSAVLLPGAYLLRVYEPPRSVVISWDTSGSVAAYIPRTLAAVRTWGDSLQPGRDAIQLLPFGNPFMLEDWAETPAALAPALRVLPESPSSDSESAMRDASEALAERLGARGIVVITDAETGPVQDLWPALLAARPRVVALSIDSDGRENAGILMDWAALNGGYFQRVIGPLGLADGMDLAAALFRAPKGYRMTASLEDYAEPEGEVEITISGTMAQSATVASGAIEVILDASGSMLQRLDGTRRIAIAHDALARLVEETLPEGTPFAFRAFGLEEDACRTELRIPLGPLERARAAAQIRGVPAINLAKTAIADSLLAAGEDLAQSSAPRVIVLVTDGEETCDGDPEAAIASLRDSGLDVRVNIVGFAIDDAALAETFAAWAEAGGGQYFDAGDAQALNGAISSALIPRFDVLRTYPDGRVEVVGSIALGETAILPAGLLTVRPGSAATGPAQSVRLLPGEAVGFEYSPQDGLVGE